MRERIRTMPSSPSTRWTLAAPALITSCETSPSSTSAVATRVSRLISDAPSTSPPSITTVAIVPMTVSSVRDAGERTS